MVNVCPLTVTITSPLDLISNQYSYLVVPVLYITLVVDVGTTELTSGETAESNSNTPAPNAANAPLQAQYNAMYTLPLAK